jgi:hypothetical protein
VPTQTGARATLRRLQREVDMMGATDVFAGETIEPSKPDPKPGR